MVFKMIGLERMWKNQLHDTGVHTARPRQIFVTQSRVLAEKVEEYFIKMSQALEVEWQDSHPHQLRNVESGMFDRDEEEEHNSTLPSRFSDLTDDNFPLFLTTDQVRNQYLGY